MTSTVDAPQRELTFGEKAAGVTFNPSNSPLVDEVKSQFADIIDVLNTKRSESDSGDVKRMYSEAITNAQTAQMWAVKAATWRYTDKIFTPAL